MRRLISSGSPFEAAAGYSRAVVDGEWIFVAGTTGFDYAAMTIAEDPAEQARQALEENLAALEEGAFGVAFASGLSAVNGVLNLLRSGDHVIACRDLYGGSYRIFNVKAGKTVNISGLTVAKGSEFQGSGIYNAGTLTVSDSTFSGNSSSGTLSGTGGGIYNAGVPATRRPSPTAHRSSPVNSLSWWIGSLLR